ncbi:c-type cytochrome [Azorhizobium doebereinerae]|uniref:c-type cytochrome n=1 Tax=Azorhizobium doebereinerae TaxID=281091 RepID=UPI0003FA8147|nr:c-type cytochrome [Azorhizobium doebereinerae]
MNPRLVLLAVAAAALLATAVLVGGAYWSLSAPASHWASLPVPANATVADLLPRADPAAGARLFRRCAACHTLSAGGQNLNGPNLHGVMGAAVGRANPRFGYSAALQAAGGRWDAARMDAWLTSPQGFAPGTTMGFPGLPAATDRADLIAYLIAESAAPAEAR